MQFFYLFIVDVNVPFFTEQFLNNGAQIIISLLIIAWVFYYFLAALVPIVILFYVLYMICRIGIRDIKRCEYHLIETLLSRE